MSISPYVHQYRDHAAFVSKYDRVKETNYSTIDVESVIRKFQYLDLSSFKQGMKKGNNKASFLSVKKFFDDFRPILEKSFMEPKNSTLCFENGKMFWANRKKDQNFNNINDINKFSKELKDVIDKTNNFIKGLNAFIDSTELVKLAGRLAIEELANPNQKQSYNSLVRDFRNYFLNQSENVVIQSLSKVENTRLKNLLSQRESLIALYNKINLGIPVPKNIVEHAVCSIFFYSGILSGAIEELQLEAILNTDVDIPNFLLSNSVKATRVGANTVKNIKGGQSISKGDLLITWSGANAAISSVLLSVKSTGKTLATGSKDGIMVQSKTPLKKFLDGKISGFAEQGLLNILLHGWHGKDAKGGLGSARYSNAEKQQLIQHIARANAVLALAGDARLDSGGYVDYLVVNRRVYTMYDLLHTIARDWNSNFFKATLNKADKKDPTGSLTAIAKERLSAKPGEQEEASERAREKILNLHFDIKLSLNLLKI